MKALLAIGGPGPGWRHAVRTALCMALPVLIGWALGHEIFGLTASIGGFAGLYGANEAYQRRAAQMGAAGAMIILASILGQIGSFNQWLGVLLIALFAGFLVLIMQSWRSGPPGAYVIVLVAATSTVPHQNGAPFWQTPALIAGGVVLAWLVQMSGWVFAPRHPQRRVTMTACRLVEGYIRALGTVHEARARASAAATLFTAWDKIADTQGETPYFRVLQQANDLFARAGLGREDPNILADAAAGLLRWARLLPGGWKVPGGWQKVEAEVTGTESAAELDLDVAEHRVRAFSPAERLWARLRDGVTSRHSTPRDTALRVFVAACIAGTIGIGLGLDHTYWLIAASVLVLHIGAPRTATLRRGAHRLIGTALGIALTAAILTVLPHGPWLALLMAALQVAIELTIARNYAVGVMFVTAIALVVAFSISPQPTSLLAVRALDTVIGVTVAILVLLATSRNEHTPRLTHFMIGALDSVDASIAALNSAARGATRNAASDVTSDDVTGNVTSDDANRDASRDASRGVGHVADRPQQIRRAMMRLEHRLIGLQGAFDAASGESAAGHRTAVEQWGSLIAIQRLGYDTLAADWAIEHGHDVDPAACAALADASARIRAALPAEGPVDV